MRSERNCLSSLINLLSLCGSIATSRLKQEDSLLQLLQLLQLLSFPHLQLCLRLSVLIRWWWTSPPPTSPKRCTWATCAPPSSGRACVDSLSFWVTTSSGQFSHRSLDLLMLDSHTEVNSYSYRK